MIESQVKEMNLIEGKKISVEIRAELKNQVAELRKKGIEPGLATVLVGDDPASQVYVNSKIKACGELGIQSFSHKLSADIPETELINILKKLNEDPKVHGILLQLPVPKHISAEKCIEVISPKKDVDGLHVHSIGKLCESKTWDEIVEKKLFVPCTPLGVMTLLEKMKIDVKGKKAVIVGRSNLVGKPVSMLLLSKNATVTIAHSRTQNLAAVCKEADIVVAAIGKPKFVTKDFVKQGAVVIDVGINRTEQGLCGDVDFENVKELASYITPVPGGVGPMTITMLMKNTIMASTK